MSAPTTTQIKKSYSHDRMKISIKFPSNASLVFSAGRSGEKLELAFSNDRKELAQQSKIVGKWLDFRNKNESNQDRFDRLEAVARTVKSGKEFIAKITSEK
jgi:K+/H+ antiporter YhaU regulatory subunit KhtT